MLRRILISFCIIVFCCAGCAKKEIKKEYYPNGKIMAEKTIQGLKSFSKVYSPDGILIGEYHYKNAKLHGKTKMYFNNGKIFREIDYKNGDIRRMDQYDEAGNKVIKGS